VATSTDAPATRTIPRPSPAAGALATTKLLLRSYTLADSQAVFEAIDETRPSLERWVPDIGCRRTVEAVRGGLAHLITPAAHQPSAFVYGVWELSSKRFVGEVGLYSIDYERGVGEVGYWLRQRARGNGYVTEAVQVLASHAAVSLGLSHLEAHIACDNLPSRRLVERLGFRVTGQRAPAPRWDGEVGDVLIYSSTLHALAAQSPLSV
jgi:RimJ/RimL family protein N-acetyltransferase